MTGFPLSRDLAEWPEKLMGVFAYRFPVGERRALLDHLPFRSLFGRYTVVDSCNDRAAQLHQVSIDFNRLAARAGSECK